MWHGGGSGQGGAADTGDVSLEGPQRGIEANASTPGKPAALVPGPALPSSQGCLVSNAVGLHSACFPCWACQVGLHSARRRKIRLRQPVGPSPCISPEEFTLS